MKPSRCRKKLAAAICAVQFIFFHSARADEVDEFVSLLYEGYAETFIQGTDEIVRYQIVDGMAIMEGDILLGEHEQVQAYGVPGFKLELAPRAREGENEGENKGKSYRSTWPNGEIPYSFHRDLPSDYIENIKTAIEWIESAADIRFVKHSAETDYVEFYPGSGCHSMVGHTGGMQRISLGSDGCASPGVIAHELLHTLGFWHEQSRPDRSQYININWNNVQSGTEYNFQKAYAAQTTADGVTPYDFESIMHYRHDAFTTNGLSTIAPKDPAVNKAQIGQRKHLSKLDKTRLVQLYGSKQSGDEVKLTASSGTKSNLSVKTGKWIFFEIQVPKNLSLLTAQLSGGTGDADLYMRLGEKPDVSHYECRSYSYGNTEECAVNLPISGTWYIGIYGDNPSSDLKFDWQVK